MEPRGPTTILRAVRVPLLGILAMIAHSMAWMDVGAASSKPERMPGLTVAALTTFIILRYMRRPRTELPPERLPSQG